MSRGPGYLGLTILDILAREPAGRQTMKELRERLPLHVRDKSLYRAIKSLSRLGYVSVEGGGRSKVVSLVERPEYAEELKLAREAVEMVAMIARARGVPMPKLGEKIPNLPPVVRRGGGSEGSLG